MIWLQKAGRTPYKKVTTALPGAKNGLPGTLSSESDPVAGIFQLMHSGFLESLSFPLCNLSRSRLARSYGWPEDRSSCGGCWTSRSRRAARRSSLERTQEHVNSVMVLLKTIEQAEMRIHHEALWDLPVLEAVYEEQYCEYYGEKFGWEEIIERVVEGPLSQTEYDENGNETRIYYQGTSYLRSEWLPREKREESRSSTAESPEAWGLRSKTAKETEMTQ